MVVLGHPQVIKHFEKALSDAAEDTVILSKFTMYEITLLTSIR